MMLGERKYIWKKWTLSLVSLKVSLEPSSPSEMKQAKTGDKAFLAHFWPPADFNSGKHLEDTGPSFIETAVPRISQRPAWNFNLFETELFSYMTDLFSKPV